MSVISHQEELRIVTSKELTISSHGQRNKKKMTFIYPRQCI